MRASSFVLDVDRLAAQTDRRRRVVRPFSVEVAFFWHDKEIGSSIISPQMMELGAVVVVKVPHPSPNDELVQSAFRARSPDGREFTIDIVRVKPDTNPGDAAATATISGYLRKVS